MTDREPPAAMDNVPAEARRPTLITPEQAAYETWGKALGGRAFGQDLIPWPDLHGRGKIAWKAAADAAVDRAGDRAEQLYAAELARADLEHQLAARTASRDRAVDQLAAVRSALGWDDSRWVEWLVSRDLPVEYELARTVTMIGQGPDLAGDVRKLRGENGRLRDQLAAQHEAMTQLRADHAEALAAVTAENERLKTELLQLRGAVTTLEAKSS